MPLYFCLGVPTISLVANLILLPESMWWLALKGKTEAAKKTLVYMYSGQPDFDLERSFAELEYTIAKEVELAQAAKETSYIDCFRGIDARRTFCAIFPPLTQNLTGQNLAGTVSYVALVATAPLTALFSSTVRDTLLQSCRRHRPANLIGDHHQRRSRCQLLLILRARVEEGRSLGVALLGTRGHDHFYVYVPEVFFFFSFLALRFEGSLTNVMRTNASPSLSSSPVGIALIDVIGKGEYSDAAGKCLTFFVALFIAASTLVS